MDTGGHQSGNMRHINHQVRIYGLCNLSKSFKIYNARIGTGPGNDHFGFVFLRFPPDIFIIDGPGLLLDTIVDKIKQFS